jgi:2',3'-cyclic-nucleotide 2'-phosphodiesterase (5'-nucleotidase family)
MKKVLLGASALALSAGFAGPVQAEYVLNILHINDFHARFESITGTDSNCSPEARQGRVLRRHCPAQDGDRPGAGRPEGRG